MNQRKLSRIAQRLFMAQLKLAKLHINYDDISKNENGIYIGLDGNFEFDSIENSLSTEIANLDQLADQFSMDLMKNKDKIDGLQDIDVESIDKKNYKIKHDESKNELYLFLPVDAYNSTAKSKREKAVDTEQVKRTEEVLNKTLGAMKKFLAKNEIFADETTKGKTIKIFAVKKEATDTIGDYEVKTRIERIIGKRNDQIESRLYLRFKYNGEVIYDKVTQSTFKYKDYGIKSTNRDDYGSEFFAQNNGNDFDKMKDGIDKLVKDCNKADSNLVRGFEKDLMTENMMNDIMQNMTNYMEI